MRDQKDFEERENGKVDEWGDPVKKKDPPRSDKLYTDEWGDPVKKIDVNEENREFYNETEKIEVEKQLVREGIIYPRGHYLPKGRFRGILALILAFLFGIFVVLGAIAGAGLYFGSAKLKRIFGDNISKYLTSDYADMSIIELISAVAGDLKDGISTLDDISKYTPLVDTLLDKADEYAEKYGVEYDRATLKSKKFGEIWGYVYGDVVKNIALGKTLYAAGFTDPTVLAILVGEEGVDYRIEEGKLVLEEGGRKPVTVNDLMTDVMGTLNTVQLGLLLGLNKEPTEEKILGESAVMYALAYGRYGQDYTLENGKIKVLTDKAGSETFTFPTALGDLVNTPNAVVNCLELGSMLGIGSNVTDEDKEKNALMLALCYGVEGKDYDIVGGKVVMKEDHDAKYPTTVGSLTSGSNELINGLELGSMLGIADGFTQKEYESNTLMYSIAYGNEGTDYTVVWDEDGKGKIVMNGDTAATTVGDLTSNSNELINGLELGTMLGIGSNVTNEDKEKNALMLALCYGVEGKDYDIVGGKVVMKVGHDAKYPTTVGRLSEESSDLIDNMEVETLLGIELTSDKLMHYLAYGPEMQKGETPYTQAGSAWTDAQGRAVDAHGYLLGEDGKYLTEDVKGEGDVATGKLQYAGGGRYVYTYGPDDAITGVEMLPDPNDSTGATIYSKRTVKNLTGDDAQILGGMKIGDVMKIGDSSSGLMRAMKDWTLDDLKDQSMIESLTIKELLDVDEEDQNTSGLMKELAKYEVGELKNPETIDGLNVGNILGVNTSENSKDSGLMKELAQYNVGQLKNPDTIDGLNVGNILGVDSNSSPLMKALANKKVGDLKKSETIESLKLGEIIEMDGSTSGILKAMEDWKISDLKNQNRIERLRIGQIIDFGKNPSGLMATISTWRVGDFSDQTKINSLTLGDVIDIPESETGILAALADAQIGDMQAKINTLTLKEMLGDNFGNNAILNLLADSTIATLADDMSALTIGELFADQVYSYMEVEEEAGKKLTYQTLYDDYYTNHAKEKGEYEKLTHTIPKAVQFTEGDPLIISYKVKNTNTTVTKGYFEQNDTTYVRLPDNAKVIRKVDKDTTITTFVYQKETELKVIKTFKLVSYNEGTGEVELSELPEGVEIGDPDEYGNYSYTDGAGKHEVDCIETYQKDGAPYTDKVLKKGGKAYCVEEVTVIERYAEQGKASYNLTDLHEEKDVVAVYQHKKSGTGGLVELERYLSGVWFLLLGKTSEPTQDHSGGVVTFDAEVPLLKIADNITGVNKLLTDQSLWQLYFFGILPDDPYVSIPEVTFKHGDDSAATKKVNNLNDITISELVPFITAFMDKDFLTQYLASLTGAGLGG